VPARQSTAPSETGDVSYDHLVVLRPGDGQCRVRFWAGTVDRSQADRVVLMYISRIETLESPGCSAGRVYDADPALSDLPPNGGFLPLPGHETDPAFTESNLRFIDLNHDGYLDLDFLIFENRDSTNHPQFIFDPKKRLL
jgi:hypothetical protein